MGGRSRAVPLDQDDPRVIAAQQAERRLYDYYGIEPAHHLVALPRLGLRSRALFALARNSVAAWRLILIPSRFPSPGRRPPGPVEDFGHVLAVDADVEVVLYELVGHRLF